MAQWIEGGGGQVQEPRLCPTCLRNVDKSESEEFIISQKSVSQNVKAGGMRETVNCKVTEKCIGLEG